MINENYKGKLLISSPEIAGDLFDKSIILICEHDANGTMGFIINKPLIDINVGTIWANLGYEEKNLPSANGDVFMGGPLASGTKEITDDIQKGQGPRKLLFLLGYSGWAPGQLEDEIMRDSWFVSEKIENLIFGVDYQSKWSEALFLIGIDPSKLSSYAGSS